MGGKALGFPTDRISSYERNTILDQLSTPLLKIFKTVDSPKPEPNKETHGGKIVAHSFAELISQ
jgi:hypothetical protein